MSVFYEAHRLNEIAPELKGGFDINGAICGIHPTRRRRDFARRGDRTAELALDARTLDKSYKSGCVENLVRRPS